MTTHKLIALALLLTLLAPTAAATIGPAPSTLASPCTPSAAYDPACDVDHDGDVDVSDVQLAAGHWNQSGVWTGGDYWSLTGNTGTAPGTHFLGTTDNQALELHVGGQRALKLDWTGVGASPNLLGGYFGNSVTAGVDGATISGGGHGLIENRVTDRYGTVGGGARNRAGDNAGTTMDTPWATVGGGMQNTASGPYATVGGGYANTASGNSATVGGGNNNTASGIEATIGGGTSNTASDHAATIGGGKDNTASANFATVPGGSYGNASHYGELAYASGRFAADGDAQTSLYVLRRETGDATLAELFLDGSAERITLAADRVMTFDILVVGSHRFGGSSAGYQVTGVIRNIGGATAFVGTPIKTVLGENNAAWDVQVEADDGLDALVVKVQGSSGTTIRWVASVRTVEVGR